MVRNSFLEDQAQSGVTIPENGFISNGNILCLFTWSAAYNEREAESGVKVSYVILLLPQLLKVLALPRPEEENGGSCLPTIRGSSHIPGVIFRLLRGSTQIIHNNFLNGDFLTAYVDTCHSLQNTKKRANFIWVGCPRTKKLSASRGLCP